MKNLAMVGVHRVIDSTRRFRASRSRRPPTLVFGESGERDRSRIFYLSPDPTVPRGGVRVLYRHVDLLNEAGFDAAVIHQRPSYRADWFANRTRIAAARDVVVTANDILVVPEFYGSAIAGWPSGPTIILFNQGAYYTFDGISLDAAASLEHRDDVSILTISEDSLDLLRFAFPHTRVGYVRSVVDGSTFSPSAPGAPRRRIAYAANRRSQERHQLLSILALRGRVDWDFIPIRGMTEEQVADTLRSSAIFLAFNEREGFGLPPAEAMACGCYVIGYHGRGAREFFDPAYCSPIADSDLLAFANAIEDAVASYDADPSVLTEAGQLASRVILDRYSSVGLRSDLVDYFTHLRAEGGDR